MSDVKQVKVDNWGIYFLQRLKHFFNRTDYCDLTLQFQDNAQLKVHRLVLSACTEYFELLERTCEMYEDCLVMPDDLQADVVVPIVNFMYTGHLEFRMDLLERLYQTSQILNMPVLGKLLESHRNLTPKTPMPTHSYSASGARRYIKHGETKSSKPSTPAEPSQKRSYSKAFDNKVMYQCVSASTSKPESVNNSSYLPSSPVAAEPVVSQKPVFSDPRPTRYEIPEELDSDNVFDNSFCSISYTSQPLMIHPDTVKRYSSKRSGVYNEPSSSKKLMPGMSTVDIVDCKRVSKEDNIFDDSISDHHLNDETEMFHTPFNDTAKDSNQLFDQILDHNEGPKVTIETKDSKSASNLDHARIISEVLKKYPHLVKSNKNIKLKILDSTPSKGKKHQKSLPAYVEEKPVKLKTEAESDYTFETDVIDSKQAAKLIAMGAENTKGPWICLICGTPGKALHFPSYYKFRRHLVEVHNEKPVANICEYCGLRSLKRNYLLHHLYIQHSVPPPPQYHFPKCNQCSYIALTEGLLVKHKMTHKDVRNFRCNVCPATFCSSTQLLTHIQNTGHKYSAEKKTNLQCIYCLKVFLREANLYAHIKTHHRKEAKSDCIIEDSDEEKATDETPRMKSIKYEPSTSFDNEYEEVDLQYPVQQRPMTGTEVVTRKQHNAVSTSKQKILNPGFGTPKPAVGKAKPKKINEPVRNELFQDIKITNKQDEEIVMIDNNEYIMRDHQLIPKKQKSINHEYIVAGVAPPATLHPVQQPTTSVQYTNVQNTHIEEHVQQQQPSMIIKKTANINQPIQIVVSNEEEYKALMASNHPIIFDNGDANKSLSVLTTQHDSTMDSTAIDLDSTQSNEMMIIPEEYPLSVTEAVTSDNSNMIVVYSHAVDDPNKQYQILTTGGIGAQFVQSSAIITQNYETVTTSTAVAVNAHRINTEVEQHWQNNVESIESQQIHLAPETEMQVVHETHEVDIATNQNESGNQITEHPEVVEKSLPPQVCIADITPSQSAIVNIQNVEQPVDPQVLVENQHVHETQMDTSSIETANETIIEKETTPNELDQSHEQKNKTLLDILSNDDNVNVNEEPIMATESIKASIVTETVIHHMTSVGEIQQMETENVIEQALTNASVMQPRETECEQTVVAETEIQPMVTETVIRPLVAETVLQHMETEPIIKTIITETVEPMETEKEEPTTSLEKDNVSEQNNTVDFATTSANTGDEIGNLDTLDNQQAEHIESQAYDEIVEINKVNYVEPIHAKEAVEKIQHLASEWSEDEYDVVEEDTSQIVEKVPNEHPQDQVTVSEPEVEESIENIQQEMKKQLISSMGPDAETEESAISSQEEDSSSQELQLPPMNESPVNEVSPTPQAQQKISSLLNDWEDNDSQEEAIAVHENVVPTTDDTDVTPVTEDQNTQDSSICLPTAEDPILPVLKNDKIKSLVSDWDDDDEEEIKD